MEDKKIINIISKNKSFIETSKVYINMIYECLNEENFIVILTDNSGCILHIQGKKEMVKEFSKAKFSIGNYVNEKSIGTNVMDINIGKNKSFEITYKEDFINDSHKLICSSALIHDSNNKIIGGLSLIVKGEKDYSYNLKLIVFAAKVIENELYKSQRKVILKHCKTRNEQITGAFYNFEDIIGKSDAIINVITKCKVISKSPSTVLITGESGTGKEVLAQAMHNYSYRKNKKFIAINCGAIPENIIESELFGYEDGTFTGGRKGGKQGKFELAEGGTIFLDEIGEMSLQMQVHLLRVLQERKVARLGSNREIPVNVRVIAATNKDLKEEIKKGNFREDLYYRLSVIPIKIPPLRNRNEDIEILIKYFLRKKSLELNKTIPSINNELYKNLLTYNWPGNIRQLENYIENIVNLDGELSFDIFENNVDISYNVEKSKKIDCEEFDNICTLKEMEKNMLIKAIRIFKGNVTKAAKSLGISRNTLYLKMKKFKIEV